MYIASKSLGRSHRYFYNKETLEPLRDQAVVDRVVKAFEKEGADAWYLKPSSFFLGDDYDEKKYVKVMDIADVWFDSGSTHSYVLEDRKRFGMVSIFVPCKRQISTEVGSIRLY